MSGSAPSQTRRHRETTRLSRLVNTRCNWSGLIAVSFQYSCSDELFASLTARARAVRGAPIRKCVGVDVDPQNGVSVSLESTLHFLGNLQPLFPGSRHLVAIVKDFQQRRIVFLFDPVSSDRRRRPVLELGHG